jgi:hypothetical protein
MVQPVAAVPITWTDWTSATTTTASGQLGSATVDYNGRVFFAQTGTGINYWTEGDPPPYTGNDLVDNAPTPAEMIALAVASSNTLTFSTAVTNPIMAIVSMGQLGLPVSYDFDTPFTVLSEGRGYWGDGWYTTSPGDILTGYEMHGVIQFLGTVSSISWTSTAETWHGFTLGLASPVNVAEPSVLALLGLGLVGIGFSRRRQKAD